MLQTKDLNQFYSYVATYFERSPSPISNISITFLYRRAIINRYFIKETCHSKIKILSISYAKSRNTLFFFFFSKKDNSLSFFSSTYHYSIIKRKHWLFESGESRLPLMIKRVATCDVARRRWSCSKHGFALTTEIGGPVSISLPSVQWPSRTEGGKGIGRGEASPHGAYPVVSLVSPLSKLSSLRCLPISVPCQQ